jgi:hypothetical protein
MSKTDFAKQMDKHWRYGCAPKKFKLWFAHVEWKRSKGTLKPRKTDSDSRFNKILRRYGLGHLQIMRLENRNEVLGYKGVIG